MLVYQGQLVGVLGQVQQQVVGLGLGQQGRCAVVARLVPSPCWANRVCRLLLSIGKRKRIWFLVSCFLFLNKAVEIV